MRTQGAPRGSAGILRAQRLYAPSHPRSFSNLDSIPASLTAYAHETFWALVGKVLRAQWLPAGGLCIRSMTTEGAPRGTGTRRRAYPKGREFTAHR